ncbi:MFS transporter [Nesterenkonia populi]|uniref:MFS transporter n=1 Tax=Nesterenkonia populi TaxID=1591087 RepID=UPI0011BFCEF2|nr:MFS transporter [Nesterenkonia populi]
MTQPAAAPDRRVLAALMLPMFASLLSISSVMVALPAIEAGLGASSSDLQWVLSGYALAFGVGMVPAGRAGDLWGRRRMFLIGAGLFGLASLGAALAPTPTVLNLMRFAMGFGSSLLVPQVIGMIQRLFTGSARGRAYGMMSTVIGLGLALGPLIAGVLLELGEDRFAWRLVMAVNVPVVAVALVLAYLWLPVPKDDITPPEPGQPRGLARLDPLGAVLLTTAILLILLPVIQFQNLVGAALAVAGLVLLGLWVLWERSLGRRSPGAPMVDLRLFAIPSFTWNSSVLILYFAGMPAMGAVVAVYVQQGMGHSALVAGLVTLPAAMLVMLLSAQVGRRVERLGPRMMVVGTAAAVGSAAALMGAALLMGTPLASVWWIVAGMTINGVAQALIIPSAQTLSMQEVPEHVAGASGGVTQTAQRIVTAIGMAGVTGVYYAVADGQDERSGLLIAALVLTALMSTALVAAVFAARRASKR